MSVSACSTGTPAADSPPTQSEPSPTASAPPALSSNGELLFTISATATSADGASVSLSQQVFAPVEFDDLPDDLQAS